jgi:hypothetical protein
MERISEKFYAGSQSLHHETLWKVASAGRHVRIKVEICRDSHNSQSYIRAFAFDCEALRWNLIASSPITSAACESQSYAQKSPKIEPFRADAKTILAEVALILGVA